MQTMVAFTTRDHSWVGTVGFRSFAQEVDVAVGLALKCGENMRATAGAAALFKDGDDGIDPQTATDLENERLVTAGLREAFPSHDIIGEESSAAAGGVPAVEARPTWIIDPIDGTQNFCHGMPESVVSIGLAVGGLPELGVIYDPYRDDLYVGVVEEGAYLNGRRLPPADEGAPDQLDRSVVLSDLGYERSAQGSARLSAVYRALLDRNVFAFRIVGSTVLSLAWLASGRCDAVIMGVGKRDTPKAWDWCAGWALGRATGCTFRRLISDRPFALASSSVCAARREALAEVLQASVREAVADLPMDELPSEA